MDEYLNAVGDGFCPYIFPALKRGTINSREIILENRNLEVRQFQLLVSCLCATEEFRLQRSQLPYEDRSLLCINMNILNGENAQKQEVKPVIDWVHWILKCQFTKKGVMFGKFWVGEQKLAKNGKPCPIPDRDFISIRSTILPADGRFFSVTPKLMGQVIEHDDLKQVPIHEKLKKLLNQNFSKPLILKELFADTQIYF